MCTHVLKTLMHVTGADVAGLLLEKTWIISVMGFSQLGIIQLN